MIQIIQLKGTDRRLYELVAPLGDESRCLKAELQLPVSYIGRFCLVCGSRKEESYRFYTRRREEERVYH